MMTIEEKKKILYFEHTLDELLQWYEGIKGSKFPNDFSILKSLKLLFFVAAASSQVKGGGRLLHEVFNDFVAMPYGHVESNVYNLLRDLKGNLNKFKIDNRQLLAKEISSWNSLVSELDSSILTEITSSVNFLKAENNKLVLLSPFELVNLSHAWHSWKSHYNKALSNGAKSQVIPINVIENEDKVFNLQSFY